MSKVFLLPQYHTSTLKTVHSLVKRDVPNGKIMLIYHYTVSNFAMFLPNTSAQDYTKWDLPEGATRRIGKGRIYEIKYSPDGNLLAVASSIGIWLYDAKTGKELDLLTGHTPDVESVCFSPDGKTIAGASYNTVRLWDVSAGQHIRKLRGIRRMSVVYVSHRTEKLSQAQVGTKPCDCGTRPQDNI